MRAARFGWALAWVPWTREWRLRRWARRNPERAAFQAAVSELEQNLVDALLPVFRIYAKVMNEWAADYERRQVERRQGERLDA